MSTGIILFGAMGTGDTTLGKAVSEKLAFPHLDIDEYTWDFTTPVPYTKTRPREERIRLMKKKLSEHPHFVMSGSMFSIREHFRDMFALAVFIQAPPEICAERVKGRSLARWGARVLPGGDMYETHELYRDYLAEAKRYFDESAENFGLGQHQIWISEMKCPVLYIDGTKPVEENANLIVSRYCERI